MHSFVCVWKRAFLGDKNMNFYQRHGALDPLWLSSHLMNLKMKEMRAKNPARTSRSASPLTRTVQPLQKNTKNRATRTLQKSKASKAYQHLMYLQSDANTQHPNPKLVAAIRNKLNNSATRGEGINMIREMRRRRDDNWIAGAARNLYVMQRRKANPSIHSSDARRANAARQQDSNNRTNVKKPVIQRNLNNPINVQKPEIRTQRKKILFPI